MKKQILAVSAVALGLLVNSTFVMAQSKTEWKPMREGVFNSENFKSTVNFEEKETLLKLWERELANPRPHSSGGFYPSFALYGDVRDGGAKIVFSIFSTAGSDRCSTAENGASAHDSYIVCKLRITKWPNTNGHVDLPNYCMIFGEEPGQDRIEYAYDSKERAIKFRAIQYGKVVPSCNRTLKIS